MGCSAVSTGKYLPFRRIIRHLSSSCGSSRGVFTQENVGNVLRLLGSENRDKYPLNVGRYLQLTLRSIPVDLNLHENTYSSIKFPPRHILKYNHYLSYGGSFEISMQVTVKFVQWIILLKTTRSACPRNKLGRMLRGTVCVVALRYGP